MVAGDAAAGDLEQATAEFVAVRGRLFGIAYRMLGSSAEAEDIVQEAWLRWQMADRSAVVDPAAFLATTTTRLCLNALQSARARRETYIGQWLPEPVDTSADPHLGAERGEALELATVMLLEKLPPTERAAYVLREAFDYPYARIADVVQVKEENARQLVSARASTSRQVAGSRRVQPSRSGCWRHWSGQPSRGPRATASAAPSLTAGLCLVPFSVTSLVASRPLPRPRACSPARRPAGRLPGRRRGRRVLRPRSTGRCGRRS